MDLQSARCELRDPPGVGFGLLILEGVLLVALTIGVALLSGS